ncbi:insecticidal delta-endotoxin Cry8Ea1 family protein [Bacillus cereus]|nr:insecticidal delta-endotoxin Cry8Ea1 family protein [Bacillus cereus]
MYYQPKYPLAEAPCSELQQISYEKVMNTSVGRKYQAVQQVNVGESVSAALGILATILKAVNPTLGAAAGVISKIFGFLWKQFGTDSQAQWKQFMEAVEYLVNQKITDAVRSKAVSELAGVQNALELYQEAADDWNINPNDTSAKERIRRQFSSTNTTIEFAMPSFRVSGFEVPLLTVFAQAANLHLLLLRDAVKFGNEWGMPAAEVEDYYTRLQKRTAEYTDYCTNTYDKGLKQAYDLAPNPTDYNKYPYLNPYSKDPIYGKYYTAPVDWNLFNDFRRDMILMVLDIVAVWPTYNPKIYNNPYGVQIQLSREVYSTVYGRGWTNNSSVDAIEYTLVRPPHLVTELKKLTFDERNLFEAETVPIAFSKVTNTLQYVGSSTTWEQSFSVPPIASIKTVHNVSATDIGNLSLSLGAVPFGFSFYNKNDNPITTVGYSGGWWNGIPKDEGSNQNSHHLSYVAALETQTTAGWFPTYPVPLLGEWGFGWLHNSLTSTNTIVTDRTTQVPAVKGNAAEFGATVVRGPGSTGGDLVKLSAYNGGSTQLRIVVRPSATARTRPYKLRIRYASEGNANLFVGKYVVNRWWETGNFAVDRTFSGAMTYNSFKYLDAFNFAANEEEFKIEFRCNSGGPIYIDKIEFIPVNPIPEPEPPKPPEPLKGTYQIRAYLTSNVASLFINSASQPDRELLTIQKNYNQDTQKWKLVYDEGKKAYQIKSLANENLVLTWVSPDFAKGITNHSYSSQYWIIEDAGDDGYVYLRNYANDMLALDLPSSMYGMYFTVKPFDRSSRQRFRFNKLS